MPDIKEKLVELIAKAKRSMWGKNGLSCELARNMYLAEQLIANGVTIQPQDHFRDLTKMVGWNSVEEALPEENTAVIVATDRGVVFQCWYAYDGWDLWEGNEVTITHWMPLPEPPKGE